MAEKLSVQIALEGGAEIEKSASQVGGFKNLKPEEVTAKLKEMGVAAVFTPKDFGLNQIVDELVTVVRESHGLS